MFESVNTQTDGRTDRRTHGRTPGRPVYYKLTEGSGELKKIKSAQDLITKLEPQLLF